MKVRILVSKTRNSDNDKDELYATVFYNEFEIANVYLKATKETEYMYPNLTVNTLPTELYTRYKKEISDKVHKIYNMIKRHTEDSFTGVFDEWLKEDYE